MDRWLDSRADRRALDNLDRWLDSRADRRALDNWITREPETTETTALYVLRHYGQSVGAPMPWDGLLWYLRDYRHRWGHGGSIATRGFRVELWDPLDGLEISIER